MKKIAISVCLTIMIGLTVIFIEEKINIGENTSDPVISPSYYSKCFEISDNQKLLNTYNVDGMVITTVFEKEIAPVSFVTIRICENDIYQQFDIKRFDNIGELLFQDIYDNGIDEIYFYDLAYDGAYNRYIYLLSWDESLKRYVRDLDLGRAANVSIYDNGIIKSDLSVSGRSRSVEFFRYENGIRQKIRSLGYSYPHEINGKEYQYLSVEEYSDSGVQTVYFKEIPFDMYVDNDLYDEIIKYEDLNYPENELIELEKECINYLFDNKIITSENISFFDFKDIDKDNIKEIIIATSFQDESEDYRFTDKIMILSYTEGEFFVEVAYSESFYLLGEVSLGLFENGEYLIVTSKTNGTSTSSLKLLRFEKDNFKVVYQNYPYYAKLIDNNMNGRFEGIVSIDDLNKFDDIHKKIYYEYTSKGFNIVNQKLEIGEYPDTPTGVVNRYISLNSREYELTDEVLAILKQMNINYEEDLIDENWPSKMMFDNYVCDFKVDTKIENKIEMATVTGSFFGTTHIFELKVQDGQWIIWKISDEINQE